MSLRKFILVFVMLWLGTASALAQTPSVKTGAGAPEGAVRGNLGSLYLRTNGSVYVKASESGTTTGWTLLATGTGAGDFSSNTSVSVDGEMLLFSGTGGKTGKRSTLTGGLVLSTTGVPSIFAGSACGANTVARSLSSAGAVTCSGIVDADIGAVAWSKVNTTPTTLAGYGITDGASLTGTETLTNKSLTTPKIAEAFISKNADYTVVDGDAFLSCDATSAAVTLTLPTAVGRTGRSFTMKKIDSSGNACTFDGNGTETIDGALTLATTTQWTSYTVLSNGSNWLVK